MPLLRSSHWCAGGQGGKSMHAAANLCFFPLFINEKQTTSRNKDQLGTAMLTYYRSSQSDADLPSL